MKATFDLPPDLITRLKLRALEQGTTIKQLATELLSRGLDAPAGFRYPEAQAQSNLLVNEQGIPSFRTAEGRAGKLKSQDELIELEKSILNSVD